MTCEHCTIRVRPGKKTLTLPKGQILMEGLMRSGIFLRNDCGGKGTCGKCRVDINTGQMVDHQVRSCRYQVQEDITVEIPVSAVSSPHIRDKAKVTFPPSFTRGIGPGNGMLPYGAAVDLGTTTIAVYLCSLSQKQVVSSVALKNPQSLYGADVMSRIGQCHKTRP